MPEAMAVAIEAARAAGRQLLESFEGVATGVDSKSSHTDLVSDADRASETVIVSAIRWAFPEDAIVAEEGSLEPGGSGRTWYIDPLDGTINYLYGVPHWSISISCEDEKGGLLGVVYDPCKEELFIAERGKGAWLSTRRLEVSAESNLGKALVTTGFGYEAAVRQRQGATAARIVSRVRDLRRFGSAALDLAWVAAGRLDGYYETGVMSWDVSAGILLVREAGGLVTDVEGIGLDRRRGLIASNVRIHEVLRSVLM